MAEKTVKWEYKAIPMPDPRIMSDMNVEGEAGWELVCVFCQKNEMAFAYFKRQVKQ